MLKCPTKNDAKSGEAYFIGMIRVYRSRNMLQYFPPDPNMQKKIIVGKELKVNKTVLILTHFVILTWIQEGDDALCTHVSSFCRSGEFII